ncbi:4F2 cell-surface antigen heavy chain isoform X3 [Callorhinchus milii]|uniref:4F2 cell-surface antigen heavy chain isoform X3 n=1 Tax=Callorhinchus milii TaxID=7868 RepID=UPI001C3FCD93|nr:4F2 cell-surface antigen heavy chain isoform X3 [Callorhinchus milii]
MKKLIGKRKSVEGKTMEGQRVEGETVEGKTMEGQRVEGEKVEGKLMKKLIGKRKSVEGKPVEGQRVGRQKAKRKWMKRLMGKRKSAKEKAMEGQRVGGETVEGQRVEGETVEGQRVEGETVEGKPVEGQRVGRQKAKRKWMKRLIGKRKSAKEKAMERQRVGGETVEGKTMEGQRVEGQKAKGKTVRSQREEGGKAEGETTGGESVKGRTKGGERKTGDAASPETKPETEAESLEAKAKPEDRWHSAQSLNASLGSTLSRVELMVASGSDWVWARRLMASLFWLSWISLVSGALLVIVRSPECNPPPRLHWWYDGPMYQITPRSFQDSDGDGNGDLSGLKVLIDLTPNPLGTKLNKWFNTTFDFEEQNKILADFQFWLRTGVDGIFISLSTDDIETSMLLSSLKRWKDIGNEYSTTRKPRVVVVCLEGSQRTTMLENFPGEIMFVYSINLLRVTSSAFTAVMNQAFSHGENELIGLLFGNPYKGHIVSLVSENLGKLIALIMFTLPGTPIIYYGDEIGLEDYQKSPSPLMRWNNSKHDGFTVGSPWIKPDLKLCRNNTMQQSDDPLSLLSFYKQLGFFKKELESLKYGSFRKVLNETTYFAYTRQWNAHGILAVLNFGDTIHVDFTASGLPLTSLLILSSSLGLQCQIVNMKNLAIPSLEAYMLKYYVLD